LELGSRILSSHPLGPDPHASEGYKVNEAVKEEITVITKWQDSRMLVKMT
jgi:hypothetical protein